MPDCDGFFKRLGIPYEEDFADAAVHAAWVNFYFDPFYVKWLITCWFDTCFAIYNDSELDLSVARHQMAEYIRKSPYRSFEDLIEFYNPEDYENAKS